MATISDTVLVLDSWAFIEEFFDGPQRPQLDARRSLARRHVTVRDALVESYSYILRKTRPTVAREWWRVMRESSLVVLEPSLADVDAMADQTPVEAGLSMVDLAVAWAARKQKVTEVASGDRGFQALGITPLFAR